MSAAYATLPSSRNFRRVNHRHPCPKCDHPDWCRIFDDGGIHCMRTEDGGTPCKSGGWMHWPGGRPENWQERIASMPPPPPRPLVDLNLANLVYWELFKRCPLSQDHHEHLRARGMTDEEITRRGYGTLPNSERERNALAAALDHHFGQRLAGVVPGFTRTEDGRPALTCAVGGILVAIVDPEDRYIGVRIRCFDVPGGKYRWLSGGDLPGLSIGQDGNAVHVANPPELSPDVADTVFIVEGEFKASIAADRLYYRVLSVPGVTSIANVIATLEAIGGITTVIITYDIDKATNPNVAREETKLAQMLHAAGYRTLQANWSAAAGKGVDDILTSTPPRLPFVVPHPAIAVEPASVADREEFAKLQRLHSLTTQARRTPNLGAERHTLTDFAVGLNHAPEGEWVPMPYARIADDAGIPARTAERHLGKVGIRPRSREAGLLQGLVDVEVREVPQRVNPTTGEISGGYDALHVRRLAPVETILERVITAPVPEAGKRNNHGGKRTPCPKCGESAIERTTTDRCVGCGELLKQTVRVIAADEDPETPRVILTPTPDGADGSPRQDDAHPPVSEQASPIHAFPVNVYRDDKLSPTPLSIAERARALSQERSADRLARAREDLMSRNFAPRVVHEEPAEPPPPAPLEMEPPLMLFPFEGVPECQGCGALLSPGGRYCADCDPYTA